MPKIVYKIDTVSAREKLPPRKAIYWHKLDRGSSIGLQKLTPRSTGTWHARFNNTETDERPQTSLGEFSDSLPGERFSTAKDAAEKWFGIGHELLQAAFNFVNPAGRRFREGSLQNRN